ncbi:histidine ammonia-lyase [Vibrio nigripulchritudo]|uniref:histidine ammonia-lyase n=1 Tax=Vibrio nigripulchritudo TaxID=28173 RepID=UPI002491481D|nr:histidine ammonia-lyase [Vibrio nigripulchritudo]BDU35774.1 hypothetical protein TUMSATVNIG2_02430 [Vibrio nigripulchritudo]BDU41444.1 hypothetical protein TUMSATVNIG3_02420 [Vibrio nigripulchritudo]
MFKKILFLPVVMSLLLQGCKIEDASESNLTPSQTNTPSGVNVYSSIDHCSKVDDIPNCTFQKGIYVLAIAPSITTEQHQRVIKQVENFVKWSHKDVHERFNNKTVVIGVMATEPTGQSQEDKFAFALSQATSQVHGLELVFTNKGKDETLSLTTYQKLMQVFDYYVDGNSNTLIGSELNDAYQNFKTKLTTYKRTADQQSFEALFFNECNYGNGQLKVDRALGTPTPCIKNGTPHIGGVVDHIHGKTQVNLNPGALLGLMYEYKLDPGNNEGGGELVGNLGTTFINQGNIASGFYPDDGSKMYVTWANPAFRPLNQYLNKYFFINK